MTRAGFDIDGVVADWNSAFRDLLRETSGRDAFPPHEGPWRPLTNDWWDGLEYTSLDLNRAMEAVTPEWFERIQPLVDISVLKDFFRLMGQDVEPVFLTLRPIEYLSPTRRWLSQIVDDPQVHCALGPNDKGCLARDLNVSVYFDDYEPNLSAVRGRAGARCYLVDASYNQHVTAWPRVKTDPAQWKAALGLDIS